MNRKFFTAIIIALCSAFIITIAATSVVLYSDYKTGAAAAETRFNKLFKQTEETISRTSVPDKQFMDSFKSAIGSTEYYYSINLKSGTQDIYLLSDEPKTASQLFTVTKSRRITEGSTIDLTLTVVMYAIPTTMVYSRLRITFLVTLFITLLSALCLIYLYATSKNAKSNVKDKKSETSDSDDDDIDFGKTDIDFDSVESNESDEASDSNFDSVTEPDQYDFETSYIDPETKTESTEEILIQTPSYEEETFTSTETIEEDFTEPVFDSDNVENVIEDTDFSEPVIEETLNEPVIEQEDAINSETAEKTYSEPEIESSPIEVQTEINTTANTSESSLYSTKTGFTEEKFLVTRLESELSRASSSELDLSLLLIKIPEIDFEEPCGIDCCNQILNIFHYRDIIFEYKNDGIAVIINGVDIDKAMETSEQIYAELCSTLTQNNKNTKPLIGISSRTLRFISGERLILEAEQALLHAQDDADSPIIAFRVNPEKYRKFMANKE
ncbi:MAG: hypothetical protein MJ184_01515 [Treponema sp.]|uniref:hypothetical protein n=1 Tax=Treponema sp. TaxID=166 RepID=UPI00298DDC79|nr:hypothetical protein [Treponema sp.]MCQ2600024.1 hypothetical protein [Treponema sp.]